MAKTMGKRRLAAILAADVTSGWMPIDESQEMTHRELDIRRNLFFYHLQPYRGRVVPSDRDAVLVEFASPVDAVCCAMDIQRANIRRNQEVPLEQRMQLRIGISLGRVVEESSSMSGDAVEEAVQLEILSDPGGIAVSDQVQRLALERVTLHTVPLELPERQEETEQRGGNGAGEEADQQDEGQGANPTPSVHRAYKVLTDPSAIEEFANSLLNPSENDQGGMMFMVIMLMVLMGSILYTLFLRVG